MLGVDRIRPTVGLADNGSSFSEEIEDIRQKNHLNEEQSMAYDIIVRCFLDMLNNKDDGPPYNSALRLFLTGPGGTGKTQVVKCVKGGDVTVWKRTLHPIPRSNRNRKRR